MNNYIIRYRVKQSHEISIEKVEREADTMVDALQSIVMDLQERMITDYSFIYAVDKSDINTKALLKFDDQF